MNEITTILTVMDRIGYLESQLKSIETQTIKSDIIIHWNSDEEYKLEYPSIIYRNQNKSAPLYNRFISSININTPYVFICDDDILPGKNYLERCIEFSRKKNNNLCIVSYGMIFKEGETKYNVYQRINHKSNITKPTLVNMGGQGYFLPTKLLKHFNTSMIYEEYGEDIHLGYICWLNKIPTYVLDKDINNPYTWQDLTMGRRGSDSKAQWKYPTHKPIRSKLIKKYTELGWDFNLKDTDLI